MPRRSRARHDAPAEIREAGLFGMKRRLFPRHLAPAISIGLALCSLSWAPVASAYSSWCDLVEAHSLRIALVSEPLRANPGQLDVDRLNSFYDKVIPQLDTVAHAAVWYPQIWGSPDIRSNTQDLIGAMFALEGTANDGEPAATEVQAVDDTLGVLHQQCDGKRGLPPRDAP